MTSTDRYFLHKSTIILSFFILQKIDAATESVQNGSQQLRGSIAQSTTSVATPTESTTSTSSFLSRLLYGQEFGGVGFSSLTSSHVDVELLPIDVGNNTESNTIESISTLIGRPVSLESQSNMDSENDAHHQNPYARIVGGQERLEPQRNFCMHLRYDAWNNQYVFAGCGGVLISNCHVLTAAHCSADGRMGLPDALYCNAYNPFEGNYGNPFHFSPLGKTIIHPDFDNRNNEHDIAILELDTCIDTTSAAAPLYPVMKVADVEFSIEKGMGDPTSSDSSATNTTAPTLIVSGFGKTSENSNSQVGTLREAEVPFISSQACDAYYPGSITDDMICAGEREGGIDACQGDSGGPLFYQGSTGGDTNQTAVGIVSWGAGCARFENPGVYASVAYHHDWIQEIVCNTTANGLSSSLDTSIELCTKLALKQAAAIAAAEAAAAAAAEANLDSKASFQNTCATMHEECDDESISCCGNLQCTTRRWGSPKICSIPASEGRKGLSGGRGGAAAASKRTYIP